MDLWTQSKKVIAERKANAEEKALLDSKLRLFKIAERKLKTTFIGDIAAVEDVFGHLWGLGKPDSECTELQLRWRDEWEKLRNKILNKGNAHIRAFRNEIEQYDVKWNRHHLSLEVKNEE